MADFQIFESAIAPLKLTVAFVYLTLLPHYQHGLSAALRHLIELMQTSLPGWARPVAGPTLNLAALLIHPFTWVALLSLPTLYLLESQMNSKHVSAVTEVRYMTPPGPTLTPWTCPGSREPRVTQIALGA